MAVGRVSSKIIHERVYFSRKHRKDKRKERPLQVKTTVHRKNPFSLNAWFPRPTSIKMPDHQGFKSELSNNMQSELRFVI